MSDRLRILHTESSTGWGGQEIRILTEMRGMLDRGHAVTLVTPEDAQLYPAARKLGIPVHAVPIGRKNLAGLLALRRWLAGRGWAFDVINTHSSTDSWLAAVACVLRPGAPPIVRTRHVSTAVNNGIGTRWLYLRATRHIVTTGEALRQQLHRDNGFPLERMTSVRTGIDLGRYRPLDQGECRRKLGLEDVPTVGIVATLRDWKGHDILFEAWPAIRREVPGVRLVIVGDGPYRDRLDAMVARLGIGESLRFVGHQENVTEWLNAFDVFALPSWGDEGVPQAIMQAMACGKPVVSTPVGAITEAVVADQTGLIVPPRDASALANALIRVLRDPALRASLGQAGLQRARDQFGIDAMLDRMEAVFRAAMEKS
ncbi:MAG: glycosyltransferase family 4 protein [Burkholderiales bacterium]|nr:glycosyltransferase family 4 protein [Burkholderiales bacterium]